MSDTVQNGKGSKPRPYSAQTYADNYDAIDWSKGREPEKPSPQMIVEEISLGDFSAKEAEEFDECLREMQRSLFRTDENRGSDESVYQSKSQITDAVSVDHAKKADETVVFVNGQIVSVAKGSELDSALTAANSDNSASSRFGRVL